MGTKLLKPVTPICLTHLARLVCLNPDVHSGDQEFRLEIMEDVPDPERYEPPDGVNVVAWARFEIVTVTVGHGGRRDELLRGEVRRLSPTFVQERNGGARWNNLDSRTKGGSLPKAPFDEVWRIFQKAHLKNGNDWRVLVPMRT